MSSQRKNIRLNDTDFYPTPAWCYENLDIDWTQFRSAHEPCRGDGRIQGFLQSQNIPTTHSEITQGLDFFEWSDTTDLILTNPPFSLAQQFIDYSLPRASTVIMLLRINFLGSVSRHDWWNSNKPDALHILSKRPSFTGTGVDSIDYAWYMWDKTGRVPTGIHFVKPPTREQAARDRESCKTALAPQAVHTGNSFFE